MNNKQVFWKLWWNWKNFWGKSIASIKLVIYYILFAYYKAVQKFMLSKYKID